MHTLFARLCLFLEIFYNTHKFKTYTTSETRETCLFYKISTAVRFLHISLLFSILFMIYANKQPFHLSLYKTLLFCDILILIDEMNTDVYQLGCIYTSIDWSRVNGFEQRIHFVFYWRTNLTIHHHSFLIIFLFRLKYFWRMNCNPSSNNPQRNSFIAAFSNLPFDEARELVDTLAQVLPQLNLPLNGLLPAAPEIQKKVYMSMLGPHV